MNPDLTLAALHVLDDLGSALAIYPSGFAYTLMWDGVLTARGPKGQKISPQGAGFIGGRLLADLHRAGLITSHARRHRLTKAGRRWLLAEGEPTCPHCELPLTLIGDDYGVRMTVDGTDARVHPSCVGRFAADRIALIQRAMS